MLKNLGLSVFFCLALLSCVESDRDRILRQVAEWEGREIVFPARSVFTVQGRDTVACPSGSSPYRILTYVDSVGCTSCKLQLPKWKELMAEVDSATDGSIPFLFYFHPKDLKELRYLTRRDGFTYPVCFDENDELNRLNGFPADMTFQTFLLDADNRVAAIGNPVHNPDVKRLYLRILTGKADADQGKSLQTTASLGTGEVDFGRFPYGEEQAREVTLRNTGAAALAIHCIDTS